CHRAGSATSVSMWWCRRRSPFVIRLTSGCTAFRSLRGAPLLRRRTSTSGRRERKCDREARAPPGSGTLGSDLSTVKLHERPHDGEAEANAANGPCGCALRLTEPLEDVGQEV